MALQFLQVHRATELACILIGFFWNMCDLKSDQAKQWFDLCNSLVVGYHPMDTEQRFLCLRTRVPLLVSGGNSRTNVMLAMNKFFF